MYLFALVVTYIACGIALASVYEYIFCRILKNSYGVRIAGYHLHHSLFGIVAYLLAAASLGLSVLSSIILASAGTGIIIQHTASERSFIFIHKAKII